jgi:hypothetical protein
MEDANGLNEMLLKKSIYISETGCRLWTGTDGPNGYGAAKWRSKDYLAHRLAFMCYHNVLLDQGRGTFVRRTCKQKRCIAEDHLVLQRGRNMDLHDQPVQLKRGRQDEEEPPSPEWLWDQVAATEVYEMVKANCVRSTEPNKFTGTPCLVWTFGNLLNGRPHFTIRNRSQAAYVFACEMKEGRLRPKGLVVRHACENPLCCDPNHLSFGTHRENGIDRLYHGNSKSLKLDLQKVNHIHMMHKDGISAETLANNYGVTVSTIKSVVNDRTWQTGQAA